MLVSFVFFSFVAFVFFAFFVFVVLVVSSEFALLAKAGMVSENTIAAVKSKLSNFFIVGNPPWRLNYAKAWCKPRAKVRKFGQNSMYRTENNIVIMRLAGQSDDRV